MTTIQYFTNLDLKWVDNNEVVGSIDRYVQSMASSLSIVLTK